MITSSGQDAPSPRMRELFLKEAGHQRESQAGWARPVQRAATIASGHHYRREIDGLRAIAVTAVILNHFDNTLVPGGYLGVDIFFVISGYVITQSLCSREDRSLKALLLGFYARRFKRLLPALVACVAATSLLISLFNSAPAESLKTGMAALFGLSNLYLLRVANDYFSAPSQLNAFTHTWSLGVEEQFYLIFPLLLWALLRKPAAAGFRVFSMVLTALAALSLAVYAYIGASQAMVSFYLMPLRFWELAAGCLVALAHAQKSRPQPRDRAWAENLILVLVVAALFAPLRFTLPAAIAVVALTAASLAILSPRSLAYRALTSRPASYVGILSYSLYLWHWPVLVLSRFTIGVHAWSVPILAGLIVLLASASYYWIEKPLRTRPWGRTNGVTVAWGAAAASAVAGLVAMLAVPLNGHLYTGKPAELAVRDAASLAYPYRIPQTPYTWAGADCVLASDADLGRIIPVGACTLGPLDGAHRRIMVFGNSFAAAFVHGFNALVRDDHYAVTITSSWGASPVGGMPIDSAWSRESSYYWGHVVPHMVAQLRPGDWVFLVSDSADLAPANATANDASRLALYRDGLLRLSAQVAQAHARLAVLDANPFVREAFCKPETALPQWFAPAGGPCKFLSKADTIARRSDLDAMLRQLQQEHRLVLIDLLDRFCPGPVCTFVGDHNRVLYRDEYSHPSVEAVNDAAPLLQRVFADAPTVQSGFDAQIARSLPARSHSSITNITATIPVAAVQRNTGA